MSTLRLLVSKAQGQGERSLQQDAIATSSPALFAQRGLMAVLSDGIGGMAAGERFSAVATAGMLRAHEEGSVEGDLCDRLHRAYDAARGEALALAEGEGVEGGATVAAVLIHRGRCAFLSAGDSRIYLLRGGGLIQLNREQTLGPLLDERAALGLTMREEAERNRYRASLVNHLAEREPMPCDACPRPFRLRVGDKLALLSDGIFRALDERRIEAALALPGAGGARVMIDEVRALNRPRQDNYSAIVIAVTGGHSNKKTGGKR